MTRVKIQGDEAAIVSLPRFLDDDERAFIREHYGTMSVRQIARAMGRSKTTVANNIQKMGLTPADAKPVRQDPPAPPPPDVEGDVQDTRARLVELRGMLRRQLLEAEPHQFAALSREYRAVVADIAALERESGSGEDDALGRIVDEIGRKLSS